MKVVLGVAGGIAAYKAASLLRLFTEAGHDLTVVPTASALHFVGEATWSALSGKPVHTDVWSDITDVPHVRIGQQADLVIVAPATADLLARAASGQADDLLTNVLLTARCPVVMAPAMHTEMWEHPATQANVATLSERGVHIVPPASGRLTGKDTGPGRLPEPEELYAVCARLLEHPRAVAATAPVTEVIPTRGPLRGRHVVVSAGGTREPLDPVRFLGNRSSGKQGYAVAAAAAARGARVTLVTTADLQLPTGVEAVRVETAQQLRAAMLEHFDSADVIVMAAAVADFRPADYVDTKIKKGMAPGDDSAPEIRLVRNPDILAELVRHRGDAAGPVIVGFAAETGDAKASVLEHGRAKLERKGCDVLVVNEVGSDKTFGKDENTVHLLLQGSSRVEDVGPADKRVIADAIWDLVETLV
ncbi:MAG: bifunctional phosphopantothenoylcysteine decarboxylase/phosphopantothenate--cysteine ligase CoaBC [Dermatophilaceae bacterium]|uniref:bifunctional phosphopantothenoylcysteine decarboxylase/phosphopantothenate--cysteine ligase CoaBC n=1 Tax=Phycicoccus sp. TaxID=1902410 RepID=UPI001D92E848|nr:bifunctional phosphopantothenoylcysteine decarboxylase/phosphopantothenate--cysteine ligase CoaBC [Phycicoccus sp.]MCB1238444.1 bifunctional phosphopantothenoylcysteine decarboxylase/phosphopantothenate--cysteine ligase CoaBC [Tetrasphaera sp.]HRC18071.1 bifunctional phosphopantothenoylcysteine decarboxylase/phosphopantothenate--cysteine ligase CoaBC [Phycicoccus elongatus]HRV57276.1 bifunctional phosphopantothenoylcysteine decarboxylase/phosphopantothenate--cysteine ligase CoaBC [Phycicoccus